MSGRTLLPGGGPCKASQRHSRRGAAAPTVIAPSWRPGDRMRWREYSDQYLHEMGDGEAEVLIGQRTYRVAAGDLKPA